MNKIIKIIVRDKIAHQKGMVEYICGNSDFTVFFDFDDEWNQYETKTARFIHNGVHTDVVFVGNECAVPVISDTYNMKVGVFAGNLVTTTPAYVPCKKSVLCESGLPADPYPDVYAQIMDLLNALLCKVEDLTVRVDALERKEPEVEPDEPVTTQIIAASLGVARLGYAQLGVKYGT